MFFYFYHLKLKSTVLKQSFNTMFPVALQHGMSSRCVRNGPVTVETGPLQDPLPTPAREKQGWEGQQWGEARPWQISKHPVPLPVTWSQQPPQGSQRLSEKTYTHHSVLLNGGHCDHLLMTELEAPDNAIHDSSHRRAQGAQGYDKHRRMHT